jgi:hypothetical protein
MRRDYQSRFERLHLQSPRLCRGIVTHPQASTGSHGQSGSPAYRNPSADLEYAQEAVRNIGVIVGEEPCCIAPMTLKPWRS